METTILYWGYIGIMETTIPHSSSKALRRTWCRFRSRKWISSNPVTLTRGRASNLHTIQTVQLPMENQPRDVYQRKGTQIQKELESITSQDGVVFAAEKFLSRAQHENCQRGLGRRGVECHDLVQCNLVIAFGECAACALGSPRCWYLARPSGYFQLRAEQCR